MASTVEQALEKIEQINKAFTEFKAENDKNVGKAVRDALAEAKLATLSTAIDELTTSKTDLEKRWQKEVEIREEMERKLNNLRMGVDAHAGDEKTQKRMAKALKLHNIEIRAHAKKQGAEIPKDQTMEEFNAYRSAFDSFMRRDARVLTPDEIRTLQVGVDPDGGYLVPADYSGQIVKTLFDYSPIRQIASVQEISSDRLDGIEDLGEAAAGWVGETSSRPVTATPQIGKWEIVAQEMYASPQASQRILDDAAIDVESWLADKVADKFARVEGTAFVAGTGVGQPRGFTTYPTAATGDNTRPWGTFERVNTGTNGAFAADPNGADKLFDLIAAFRPPYLRNATFVTRRSVIALVRKMKATTGNYLWQPGLLLGQPDSILGFPIVMAEDMPALATGSLSLAFGDFKQGYQIVDRLGVRTLRDPYTNKPFVIFYTTKRTGGGALNYQAVKFVQFS
jgi:HK97 family phage major capsid protein